MEFVLMPAKEIQKLLLDHYLNAVDTISKEGYKTALNDCIKKHVDSGICHCASEEFGVDIYGAPWVREISPENSFWGGITPRACATVNELLDCLSLRIDILTQLLSE